MRKLGTLLAGAAVIAMGLNAVPAQARDGRHGDGGHHSNKQHWKGGNAWRGDHGRGNHWNRGYAWHGGYHRDNGDGIALGVIGGALAGAAIASAAQPYYYSYSYPAYGYSYPAYGYYYPY
ncbi:MAG: hypothetical protein AB7H71_13160 [Alphaproteobacteria bacterium]